MTDPYTDRIAKAREALQQARSFLRDEIEAYPTPISGCDAQYTYLIGERNRVIAALGALDRDMFVATPRTLTEGSGVESR